MNTLTQKQALISSLSHVTKKLAVILKNLQLLLTILVWDPFLALSELYNLFVADGINSVGDYNSPPGGCRRRRVCVCVPTFFSRFTIG